MWWFRDKKVVNNSQRCFNESSSRKWVVGENKNFRNQQRREGIYTLGKRQST